MTQPEFAIYLIMKESGFEVRIPDGDPADTERANLILAHMALTLDGTKASFLKALAATEQ